MNERRISILSYISENGKTAVDRLAEIFGVSQVTLRTDLDFLSGMGVIKRERGYAAPVDKGSINYNMSFKFAEKNRIADAAASYVQDNESVIIESGSTCALLAMKIAETRKNVTIITDSVYLTELLHNHTNIKIILLGGIVQQKTDSLAGPLTNAAVRSFHVDKLFTGIDGYSREYGFTGDDLLRSETLRAMIESAARTYVLTPSDKLTRPTAVSFLQLSDVYELITDDGFPAEEKKFFEESGVIVTLV